MIKRLVLLSLLAMTAALPAEALPDASLFEKLKTESDPATAAQIAGDIQMGWRESGSATVDLLLARAAEAEGFGDHETARGHYDRILLIEPKCAEAWYRRAGSFFVEENTKEALRDLNQALSIEPRHFIAWFNLGLLFEQLGGKKQALEAYREALEIYPAFEEAQAAAGRLTLETEGQPL
jgi:tetratricopeptide (TPR) repeat protein